MTTEQLILMIDNDRDELGAVLALSRDANESSSPLTHLGQNLDRRYNSIVAAMVRPQRTSFTKAIGWELESLLDAVDWDEVASHYLRKVREGVEV